MTFFDTKTQIDSVYGELLYNNEEPYWAITKSVTDVSLTSIEGSLEDFVDIIKALPHTMEISMPLEAPSRSRPWQFSTPYEWPHSWIMKSRNWRQKQIWCWSSAHSQKHLHHLDEKLEHSDPACRPIGIQVSHTSSWRLRWNHYSHHRSLGMQKLPFEQFASDLFQIEVSHLYTPASNEFMLILHIPIISWINTNFYRSKFTSTLQQTFWLLHTSAPQIFSPLDIINPFKLSTALTYTHVSTSGTPSFAREEK